MNWIQVVPSVLLWVAFLARLSWIVVKTRESNDAIGPTRPVGGRLHKALLLAAMSETLNIDELYLWLDRQIGGMNVLNLVVHVCLGMGLSELSMSLQKAAGVSQRRGELLFWASVFLIPAQVVLLITGAAKGTATDFTGTFGHEPVLALYQAIFFAWVAIICIQTALVLHHRPRADETAVFRCGMNIVSAACAAACIASASKLGLVSIATVGASVDLVGLLQGTYTVMIGLTCIGFAIGLGMPAVEKLRQSVQEREWRADIAPELQKIVERVRETEVGAQVVQSSGKLPTGSSLKDIYSVCIAIRDVQAYGDDILSAAELRFLDEVEERIAPHGSLRRTPAPRT